MVFNPNMHGLHGFLSDSTLTNKTVCDELQHIHKACIVRNKRYKCGLNDTLRGHPFVRASLLVVLGVAGSNPVAHPSINTADPCV
jgi:hypothetical protein